MTFTEALPQTKIFALPEDKTVEIIIRFQTANGNGIARLKANKFFRQKEETMQTVKRAWEYACKEHPERTNAVIQIEIRPAVDINRKSAKTA